MVLRYFLLVLAFTGISAVDPCRTPNDKDGDCKPINQCPALVSLFMKRPMSETNAILLRKSQCGVVGIFPKVCCSIESAEDTTVSVISSRLLPDIDTCGVNTQSRIYGGEQTDLDEFPWMALLQYRKKNGGKTFLCGGSLINNRYVLTAAHCVHRTKLARVGLELVGVRLGEYNKETNPDCIRSKYGGDNCAPEHVDVGIEERIINEGYIGDRNNHNDVALLRLNQNISYTDFVGPICLPLDPEQQKKTYVGERLCVAGWGATESNRTSNVKLKVRVPVKPLSDCNLIDLNKQNISLIESQMCAGGEAGKDSCVGDSGGPLMALTTIIRDGRKDVVWFAAGVVSFGPKPCGRVDRPAVYTSVSKYVPWIVSKLRA